MKIPTKQWNLDKFGIIRCWLNIVTQRVASQRFSAETLRTPASKALSSACLTKIASTNSIWRSQRNPFWGSNSLTQCAHARASDTTESVAVVPPFLWTPRLGLSIGWHLLRLGPRREVLLLFWPQGSPDSQLEMSHQPCHQELSKVLRSAGKHVVNRATEKDRKVQKTKIALCHPAMMKFHVEKLSLKPAYTIMLDPLWLTLVHFLQPEVYSSRSCLRMAPQRTGRRVTPGKSCEAVVTPEDVIILKKESFSTICIRWLRMDIFQDKTNLKV